MTTEFSNDILEQFHDEIKCFVQLRDLLSIVANINWGLNCSHILLVDLSFQAYQGIQVGLRNND